jgi:hypothetical protein
MTEFLVTTPGASATRWVSFALASRPDVYVTHGKFALDSITQGDLHDERRDGDQASLTRGNELRTFYAQRSLADIFEAYRQVAPTACVHGNVHTFTIHELLERERLGQSLEGVRIANLTRHPISFVESHTALVRSALREPDLGQHYWNEFQELTAACPEVLLVSCSDPTEAVAFAVSCYGARRSACDLEKHRWPNYRMEDVTSDGAALRRFCESLTGLPYSEESFAGVFQAGPINSHHKRPKRDPLETWRTWPSWRQDLFQLFVEARFLEVWAEVGYDVRSVLQSAREPASDAPTLTCLGDFVLAPTDPPKTILPIESSQMLLPPAGSSTSILGRARRVARRLVRGLLPPTAVQTMKAVLRRAG